MTVYEFVSLLQEAHDRAIVRAAPSKQISITFIAPNSGFCGPQIRPKFLGYIGASDGAMPAEAEYGLTRLQVEQILEAFDVTLPEGYDFK